MVGVDMVVHTHFSGLWDRIWSKTGQAKRVRIEMSADSLDRANRSL